MLDIIQRCLGAQCAAGGCLDHLAQACVDEAERGGRALETPAQYLLYLAPALASDERPQHPCDCRDRPAVDRSSGLGNELTADDEQDAVDQAVIGVQCIDGCLEYDPAIRVVRRLALGVTEWKRA